MKKTYTPAQQTLLSGLTGQALTDMTAAIDSGLFYAVGIDCAMGHYNLGCTGAPGLPDVPNLFATRAAAEADLQDDIDHYQADIDAGERDEDDEFEGEVVAVRWDGGDTLTVCDADELFELHTLTLAQASGN